ncbi:MAG: glucokinase [Desulfovibrio sp.]|nr:glucokinase [Desulfovibrio sp.]
MADIYAADIGGTHARYACFSHENGQLRLMAVKWASSAPLLQAEDVLSAMYGELGTGPKPGDALAIALAGPVAGQTGYLTNGRLRLDMRPIAARLGLVRCLLLNDFAAQAHAMLTEVGTQACPIRIPASVTPDRATRAVFGAGTGLGAASLHWWEPTESAEGEPVGQWQAVPSEVGHTPFPFCGEEEQRYANALAQTLGQEWASMEDVLCGRGLERLHAFLTGRQEDAATVGREALSRETPTLQWYARFLGRFCRLWICTTLCTGGLWIAGGIAARNPLCVTCPEFVHELLRGTALQDVLCSVPVRLVTNTDSGLWGAAQAIARGL